MLASRVNASPLWRIVCGGLVLGAASALKPTNAVHAIAAVGILAAAPIALRGRIRILFHYMISVGIGFTIVAAPWSLRLERMFGNPFFPLMNGLFRSPEYPTDSMRHLRFIPDSLGAALWRPFEMADPRSMVHVELSAPDLRYAVLLVLLTVVVVLKFGRISTAPTRLMKTRAALSTRVLMALGCGFALDWGLWLSGSGNSRYFLPMACVAAALIVGLLFVAFSGRPKVRNYIIGVIFSLQAVQLSLGTEFRYNGVPWGGPWLNITIPPRLQRQPNLFLSIGILTNSFLVPYLPQGSGFVDFTGGYAFGGDGPNGPRVLALIKRYSPNVRVLIAGEKMYEDREGGSPRRSQVDMAVGRFGLRVDSTDCTTLVVNDLPRELEITLESSMPTRQEPRGKTVLVSCHLVPDLSDEPARFAALQGSKDLVLDRLEDACPTLFQPRRPYTEYNGYFWMRRYTGTDLTAWVSHGAVKFLQGIRGADLVHVGSEAAWAAAPLHLDCGRHNEVYYAAVTPHPQLPRR